MSYDTIVSDVTTALGDLGAAFDVTADGLRLREPVGGADLVALIGGAFGRPQLVPDWMPSGVQLDVFAISKAGESVDLHVTASHQGVWKPFPELTVTTCSITLVEANGAFAGMVRGAAMLEDLDLELLVQFEVPSEVFLIELSSPADADPAGAQKMLDTLGMVHHTSPDGGPVLVDLSLTGSIALGTYVIHVEAADLLQLPALTIARVIADARFGDSTSVSVFIEALVGDGIDIELLGEITADGWLLRGALSLPGEGLSIGAFAASLAGGDPPRLPEMISSLALEEVDITVDTAEHLVAFHCRLTWEGNPLDVAIEHRPDGFSAVGKLHVGDCEFLVAFDSDESGGTLVGAFSAASGSPLSVAHLVQALGTSDQIPGAEQLHIEIEDAAIAHGSVADQPGEWLLGADLGLGLDLAALRGLPLVGGMLPAGQSLKLAFAVGARSDWSEAHLTTVTGHLPAAFAVPKVADTLTFSGVLDVGGDPIHLDFPAPHERALPAAQQPLAAREKPATGPGTRAGNADTAGPGAPRPATDSISWHAVDRSFGPVHISRVGLGWDGDAQEVAIALDGSLGLGGLTLSLQGFGAHYRLAEHDLHVTLSGLGLDFTSGPVELSGAFLNVDGDFEGRVLIRTEQATITALGAFTTIDGAPSMFVYGLLDYPLGGPPCFFVEGLAAGFAYNRELRPPTLDGVRTFPLVVDAIGAAGGNTTPTDPGAQLAALHEFVRPSLGQNFLAVGVKFNSFKLIDSFLLLVVSFGNTPQIDLFGSCTYQSPPGELAEGTPALVHVGLDFVGHLPVETGELQIEAKLTNGSYVFDPKCVISGGFAFYSWFKGEYAGSFVLSIGGYHPTIHPETRTPRWPIVQPLTLRYNLSDEVSITGSVYLALAPSMIMAGCAVNATASIGSVEAGFSMSLDFLVIVGAVPLLDRRPPRHLRALEVLQHPRFGDPVDQRPRTRRVRAGELERVRLRHPFRHLEEQRSDADPVGRRTRLPAEVPPRPNCDPFDSLRQRDGFDAGAGRVVGHLVGDQSVGVRDGGVHRDSRRAVHVRRHVHDQRS